MSNDVDDDRETEYRCGGCPRRLSTAGWALCEPCSGKLADDLLEIADRWARLTAARRSEPGRFDKARPGGFTSSPPGNVHVMTMRDQRTRDHAVTAGVDYCPSCQGQHEDGAWCGADGKERHENDRTRSPLYVVSSWARLLAEEREFTEPPPTDMASLVEWLNRQDDWIARWEEAGELVRDTRRVRNALRSATGEPNPRPMAKCIALIYPDDGSEPLTCEANVFPPMPDANDPSYMPVVRCSGRERHEYTRGDLARLALANAQAKRQDEHKEAG